MSLYIENIFCINVAKYENDNVIELIKIKFYKLFNDYRDDVLLSDEFTFFNYEQASVILDILERSISVLIMKMDFFRDNLYSKYPEGVEHVDKFELLEYFKNILDMFSLYTSHISFIIKEMQINLVSNYENDDINKIPSNFIYIDNFEVYTNELIDYGNSSGDYKRSQYVYFRLKCYHQLTKSNKFILLNESDFHQYKLSSIDSI
jgi:hypothetical protein